MLVPHSCRRITWFQLPFDKRGRASTSSAGGVNECGEQLCASFPADHFLQSCADKVRLLPALIQRGTDAIHTVIREPTSGFVTVPVAPIKWCYGAHQQRLQPVICRTYTAGDEQTLLRGIASRAVLSARHHPAEQFSASRALCWE